MNGICHTDGLLQVRDGTISAQVDEVSGIVHFREDKQLEDLGSTQSIERCAAHLRWHDSLTKFTRPGERAATATSRCLRWQHHRCINRSDSRGMVTSAGWTASSRS